MILAEWFSCGPSMSGGLYMGSFDTKLWQLGMHGSMHTASHNCGPVSSFTTAVGYIIASLSPLPSMHRQKTVLSGFGTMMEPTVTEGIRTVSKFLLRGNCGLHKRKLPRVTAVACKRPRSFCQKCRWQVTAKH